MPTNTFHLPDLGEGLPDATIVEWYVKVGDTVRLDDNLVSMETAKAVVDVPSPVSGKVLELGGSAGDVIDTGAMLAVFEIDPSQPQRAEGQDTGHHHGARPAGKGVGAQDPAPDDRVVASTEGGAIEQGDGAPPEERSEPGGERADSGTVVGAMQASDAVHAEADFVGRIMIEGPGAGERPTASAVAADLLDLARGTAIATFGVPSSSLETLPTLSMEEHRGAYYLRLLVVDKPGVIADVAAALRDEGISVEAMVQRGRAPGEAVPVVIVTHETSEAQMRRSLARIEALELQKSADVLLVLEGENPNGHIMLTQKIFEYMATGKPILVATELAVADPNNAGPAAVRASGRLCYSSANRAVRALEHAWNRQRWLQARADLLQ